MNSHCPCGYAFSEGMKYCPYCGKKRSGRPSPEWRECVHEAGGYTDHCPVCAPFWKRYPVCPVHHQKLAKTGYCRQCKKYYEVEE